MNESFAFFKKTKELDVKIAEFLVNLSQSGQLFVRCIDAFLAGKKDFQPLTSQIGVLERRNDQLRRDVEEQLYVHTLLPDSRADILTLLEGLDNLLNHYESITQAFDVERPVVPTRLHKMWVELTKTSVQSVDALVSAARSFFAMDGQVNTCIAEVLHFEKLADQQGADLQHRIFALPKATLAHQRQLKDFEQMIERLSDIAEDMADKLTILSVKRAF